MEPWYLCHASHNMNPDNTQMNQEKPEIAILLDICFDGYKAVCIMIDDISLPWWTHQWLCYDNKCAHFKKQFE